MSSQTPNLIVSKTPQLQEINPNRCILIGYGPIGKIVHRLLRSRGAEVTVIDLNLETVRRLQEKGRKALYADVLRPGTLEEAGIAVAGSLILSADVEDAAEIIRQARSLNPALRILVRCADLRAARVLRRAGATFVAAGEAEVGVALAEAVSITSGTSHDAAAEQRSEIRRHLYGPPKD
jgi:CPA2 family monovalent cation:H+ antiporter-2